MHYRYTDIKGITCVYNSIEHLRIYTIDIQRSKAFFVFAQVLELNRYDFEYIEVYILWIYIYIRYQFRSLSLLEFTSAHLSIYTIHTHILDRKYMYLLLFLKLTGVSLIIYSI